MAWFSKGSDEVLDLRDPKPKTRKSPEVQTSNFSSSQTTNSNSSSEDSSPFGFFSSFSSNNSTNSVSEDDSEDKKRKLAQRLSDMTTKMEELSNQIYHLEQRLEVLERKSDIGRF